MTIPGFDSAQHAYDNAEPDNTDEEADDTPECGGCSPAYRNACIHCGPDPD